MTKLAKGLGWFSIGLGVAEVVAPGSLGKLIGVSGRRKNRNWMRVYGLREIAAGAGILSRTRPAPWLWARVAGDALDLAALGKSMASGEGSRIRTGIAAAAVAGVTAADVLCARGMSCAGERGKLTEDVQLARTMNIGKSPDEVFQYWRNVENLPKFMRHVASVEETGEESHWVLELPGGKTLEWKAQMDVNEEERRVSWSSLPGSDLEHSGSVRFEPAPGNRGTLVRVVVRYTPPGGVIGSTLAKWMGQAPGLLIEENLRALKQLLETGEIARSDASIHFGVHAAQPAEGAAPPHATQAAHA